MVAVVVGLGGRVHAVDPGRRSLEDLFLGLVQDPTRGAADGEAGALAGTGAAAGRVAR